MLWKQLNVTMIATIALDHSISLPVAPSGLECVLACQGNLSLHYAAIYELIFELHEPQQSMEIVLVMEQLLPVRVSGLQLTGPPAEL